MNKRILAAAALLGGAIAPTGCSQDLKWSAVESLVDDRFPSVSHISTDSLSRVLANPGSALVLFDTRTRAEFDVSHIPGAVHLDPETRDFSPLDTLGRDAQIITYCSVGYRSSEMAARLEEAGFVNVSNVRGSIFRWANEGRTVVRDGQPVREVHPYDGIWGRLLDPELRTYEPRDSDPEH